MPDDQPDGEVAALKRRVDELSEQLHDVHAEQQRRNEELIETLRAFGLSGEQIEAAVRRFTSHGMTRRAALLAIVGAVGAGGFIAGSERARADSTGQIGTSADPLTDVFADSVDIGSGTIDGAKDIPGIPNASAGAAPGFGSWTQASATRPVIIEIYARCETDGSSSGAISLRVDESGGTSQDYELQICRADPSLPAGSRIDDSITVLLPAGAQYIINNQSDPNGANSVQVVREFAL